MSSWGVSAKLYNNAAVICPLCGKRRARRSCPGLDQQICAVCCGTKRLTEIRCPANCTYLASAREHPAAIVLRQHQQDLDRLLHLLRDLNQRQSQLFLLVATALVRYNPPALQPLVDDDVVEASAALAATYETAVRGVIYDHRPASMSAERLMAALKSVLTEAAKEGRGTVFERDVAVVLRRVEEGSREVQRHGPKSRRAFVDLLARVVGNRDSIRDQDGETIAPETAAPSRLIVP